MAFWTKLFETKLKDTDLLEGATELHCHILAGVDDGIQTDADAQRAMEIYQAWGFKRIVCTPHIMTDWGKNNHASLRERFASFKELAPAGLELKLAAEYMLDDQFLARLEEPMLSINETHVLVETSYMAPSPIMDNQLYELKVKGFTPILAHPERYVYMREQDYKYWKSEGLLFQLNLLSLIGAYGSTAKKKAEWLLKSGYYDFVGTDTHRPKWLERGLANFAIKNSLFKLLPPLVKNTIDLVDNNF